MKIKVLNDSTVNLPTFQTTGSTGADLYSNTDVEIPPHESRLIGTGLCLKIPYGYEGQIRSRSGLAAKHNISVLNSPGTIDSDYTGEIKVILFNHGKLPFHVKEGDRIAQIVFQKVVPESSIEFVFVDELGNTERGCGGFGSTGVS